MTLPSVSAKTARGCCRRAFVPEPSLSPKRKQVLRKQRIPADMCLHRSNPLHPPLCSLKKSCSTIFDRVTA